MKFASTTALALSFALGAVALTGASPALAKKAAAADDSSKPHFSPAFSVAAQPLQKAIAAKDYATAKASLPAAQAAATTPDDKYQVALMALIVAQSTNDVAAEGPAADAVIASGKAPPDQLAQILDMKGRLAYNANNLQAADAAFTQLVQLKPTDGDTAILLAQVKTREGRGAEALPIVDQAIQAKKAAGQTVDEDWYRRALAIAFDGKMTAAVIKYGQQLVDAYPRADIWRVSLTTYRDTSKLDPQTDLDTLRLMRASGALAGERDYYDYANMALNKGFPGEAKAVIDQGMTSNMVDNKALATSKALAEVKQVAGSKIAADKADLPASDKRARASADGKQALLIGDAYLGYGEYAKAADLYKVALQKGADANVANLHLGEALAQSGDKAGAAQAFALVKGTAQPLAQYWTIWANKGSAPAAPAAAK
jgi:tetratricopeptide (TPR) repeat protein